MSLTVEQILALAPDASSAKAGSQQASIAKWSGLGVNDQALWGLCQGSGKYPYRAQIELTEPAFKCTCPSRKFPCKHGLGLYLIYAQQNAAFARGDAPQWVSDWLQSRGQRAEKKAAKQAEDAAPLSDEEREAKERSQQKRQEKRSGNMLQGLDLLDTWMSDIAREGLASTKAKSAQSWEGMAARMVDAQAPGLAVRIRRAAALMHASTGTNWELPVARELAQLALLAQSYRRLDQLPPTLQADVKTATGWVASQEDALAQPAVQDTWRWYGNHTEHEERVSRRACYYRGLKSRRWAMLLQFSGGNQPLPPPPLPGSLQGGSLHFYPGATPMRVQYGADMQTLPPGAPQSNHAAQKHDEGLNFELDSQLTAYAEALAANPFLSQFPMLTKSVVPQHAESFVLRHADGRVLPVDPTFRQDWRLIALAGGMPLDVFGLWNGYCLLPLSATIGKRMLSLETEPELAS